jgi:hypothetical protein
LVNPLGEEEDDPPGPAAPSPVLRGERPRSLGQTPGITPGTEALRLAAGGDPVGRADWGTGRGVRGVFVPLWALVALGNPYQALVLAQVLYWFSEGRDGKPRAKVRDRDAVLWYVATYEDLAGQVGLNPRTVRKAVGDLVSLGFLTRKVARYRGTPTTHLRPEEGAVRLAREGAEAETEGLSD